MPKQIHGNFKENFILSQECKKQSSIEKFETAWKNCESAWVAFTEIKNREQENVDNINNICETCNDLSRPFE
ncbi:MAG: hypothetical protein WCR55_13940 [Lentisphaerota bacterium]